MTILMKVTSRERPNVLLQTVKEYIRLANNTKDMVWLFSFDEDDTTLPITPFMPIPDAVIIKGRPSNKIAAINRDVSIVKGWDILLNISDDQIPIVKGYDDIIRKAMPESLDASLWFFDGHQRRINTQEILGRVYYERQGFIYDPRFKSFFCDNLSTMVAEKQGKLIKVGNLKECIIKHFHPGWQLRSHIKEDDLYRRNNKYWSEDMAMFEAAQKEL